MITIDWPMRIKNATNGSREHWAAKARRVKAERNATRLMLKTERVADEIGRHGYGDWEREPNRLAVRLVRVYAGKARKMDDDGCVAAFKHVRDEVAAYFGVDDADPRIRFEYAQARGTTNMVRIDFAVESDMRARVSMAADAVEATAAAVVAAHGGGL